jgi:hypothetical protein
MLKLSPIAAFLAGKHEVTRDEVVTVAATSGLLTKKNTRRTQLVLVNYGTSDVRLSFKPIAGTSEGFPLFANGGTFRLRVDWDGPSVAHELHALGVAGGLSVQVYEWEAKDDA